MKSQEKTRLRENCSEVGPNGVESRLGGENRAYLLSIAKSGESRTSPIMALVSLPEWLSARLQYGAGKFS